MAMAVDLTGCYISVMGREVVTQVRGKDKSFIRLPRIPVPSESPSLCA